MRTLLLLLLLVSSLQAAPLAGAWEGFPEEANAEGWLLFSYSDGLSEPPLWVGPEIDDNPYAYSYFYGGEGVWFIADDLTAGGAFVGDYDAQKASGLDVSVSVDPSEISFIDLVVRADGPNGPGFYYSRIYEPADLGATPGWYALSFRFDQDWFALEDGVFVAFRPDTVMLASIEEVGLRVFPVEGVGEGSFVGIDDFILVPTLAAPVLTTSVVGGEFVLEFTPNPGLSASVEQLSPTKNWEAVPGQSGLTGPQLLSSPISPGKRLFRVLATEWLTPVTVL